MFSNIFGTAKKKAPFDIHNRLENLLNEKGNKVVMQKAGTVIPMASVSHPEVYICVANRSGIVDIPQKSHVEDMSKFNIVIVQYGYDGYKNIILEIKPEKKWFK